MSISPVGHQHLSAFPSEDNIPDTSDVSASLRSCDGLLEKHMHCTPESEYWKCEPLECLDTYVAKRYLNKDHFSFFEANNFNVEETVMRAPYEAAAKLAEIAYKALDLRYRVTEETSFYNLSSRCSHLIQCMIENKLIPEDETPRSREAYEKIDAYISAIKQL